MNPNSPKGPEKKLFAHQITPFLDKKNPLAPSRAMETKGKVLKIVDPKEQEKEATEQVLSYLSYIKSEFDNEGAKMMNIIKLLKNDWQNGELNQEKSKNALNEVISRFKSLVQDALSECFRIIGIFGRDNAEVMSPIIDLTTFLFIFETELLKNIKELPGSCIPDDLPDFYVHSLLVEFGKKEFKDSPANQQMELDFNNSEDID